jgi:hypothetical protein
VAGVIATGISSDRNGPASAAGSAGAARSAAEQARTFAANPLLSTRERTVKAAELAAPTTRTAGKDAALRSRAEGPSATTSASGTARPAVSAENQPQSVGDASAPLATVSGQAHPVVATAQQTVAAAAAAVPAVPAAPAVPAVPAAVPVPLPQAPSLPPVPVEVPKIPGGTPLP